LNLALSVATSVSSKTTNPNKILLLIHADGKDVKNGIKTLSKKNAKMK
jgi:hypothetical protein